MLANVLYAAKSGETSQIIVQPTGSTNSMMCSNMVAEIKRDLRAIENAGIIVLESPDPNLSYTFANSLIRDVVYELMLYAQRRQIHRFAGVVVISHGNLIRNIVSWYSESFEGNSTYYPILAYHYKQADENDQALEFYRKAGSASLLNFANNEAITFLQEALLLISKLQVLFLFSII
jgi:predicted ATPase